MPKKSALLLVNFFYQSLLVKFKGKRFVKVFPLMKVGVRNESERVLINVVTIKKNIFYWESVAGSVIQATVTVEFEDGLRIGVLQEDCWCLYSGLATLESDMARPWRPALTQV